MIPKQLSKFLKLKNKTKKLNLKIQKPKLSLQSQNVRKETLPKYAHWFQNNFQNFQNSKIKLKNDPLKSKNLKKGKNHKMSKNWPPKFAHSEYKKIIGGAQRALSGGRRPPALRRS